MEIFLILLCIGLVLGGVAVARTVIVKRKRRKNNPSATPSPPPLPSRIREEDLADRQQQVGEFHPSAVPPRVSYSGETSGEGPRGIKPNQFPCCPYDKQRNVLGGQEVIFWDSEANCYCCSRGHRFRRNGKPL